MLQMMMLIGRVLTDGRMSARVKYDITDRLSVKLNAQVWSINIPVENNITSNCCRSKLLKHTLETLHELGWRFHFQLYTECTLNCVCQRR